MEASEEPKPKRILTKKFERDFSKPACFEYCYLDKRFCPFLHKKQEDGSKMDVKFDMKRWTDVENDTNYKVDYSLKKSPFEMGEKTDEDKFGWVGDFKDKLSFEMQHTPFSCWGDGSGFEYDSMPENTIGPRGTAESTYDIEYFGIEHKVLDSSSWNAWIEKFQKDYRFAQISDLNATTSLFPNVDDPWMFTEYIFKGVEDGEVIVEPPLYNERTLKVENHDSVFDEEYFLENNLDDKYDFEHCKEETIVNIKEVELEDVDEATGNHKTDTIVETETIYKAKQFRKVVNWDTFNRDESKRGLSNFMVNDAGLRLYRADINIESIKWGEHGNIPPHTLNMTAPANWFEERQVGKIVPKVIAHVGTPFYASNSGVLYWHESKAYVKYEDLTKSSDESWVYPVLPSGGHGIMQNMPSTLWNNTAGVLRNNVKLVERIHDTGDFIHGGCTMFKCSGGVCRCSALDSASGEDREYLVGQFDNVSQCKENNDSEGFSYTCKHRVQGPMKPLLATYEGTTSSRSEFDEQMFGVYSGEGADQRAWADSVSNSSIGLPGVDMFVALGMYASQKRGRDDIRTDASVSVWYETSFEMVYEDLNAVELLSGGIGEFRKGAEVKRGSGKMAINTDSNSSPLRDGRADTFAFGDADQISFHRWFNNIMHCQNCTFCNDVYGEIKMKGGFDPLNRAGGDGECRYYKNTSGGGDCPTDNVPKRAYEFQMIMRSASNYFWGFKSMWMSLDEAERLDYNAKFLYNRVIDSVEEIDGELKITYRNEPINDLFFLPVILGDYEGDFITGGISDEVFENFRGKFGNGEYIDDFDDIAYVIYSKNDVSTSMGGATIKGGESLYIPQEIIDYIKSRDDYDEDVFSGVVDEDGKCLLKSSFYKLGMIKFSGDVFFWYDALTDSGELYDTWFVRADINYPQATFNTVIVDNEEKFIGGFHPQYKDYSEKGEEFLMDVESDSYRDAMGDITDDYDHMGIPQPINKKGYWVDFSGRYIIDEEDIGINKEIIGDDDRKKAGKNNIKTISFRESTTSVNVEEGTMTRPKTINCAVQANDPYYFIHYYKTNKGDTPPVYNNGLLGGIKGWLYPDARPIYEDDEGNEYWAPPYTADMFALPTMRMSAHCPDCDYYLVFKYHNLLCPWCGKRLITIPGDRGNGLVDGKKWDSLFDVDNSVPEAWEDDISGEEETDESDKIKVKRLPVIQKFFKIKSIGKAQVWAPPGTSVHKDAYFWKSPTPVGNTIKTQIKSRLGGKNEKGVYTFDGASKDSVFTLGAPDQIGYFKPMPDFVSVENDGDNFYKELEWEGVTKESRSTYASFNDIMPTNLIPGFGSSNIDNENLILPYTNASNDGLKMMTIDEIKKLRNTLQPMLAYVSDDVAQNDFDTLRASYESREKIEYPRYYTKRKCRAPSVVQAVAQNMGDSYVQFFSGDRDYGSVREYYPAGHSWWKLNNLIGGKYDDQTGGFYHFSGGNPWGGGEWLHSKAAVFIHGMLPLDKEIISAYAVVYPAGEPYKEPIGRAWNGVVHYEHYHPFTEDHAGKDGEGRHLHGQAGYLGNFDSEGNYTQDGYEPLRAEDAIRLLDESDYFGWGAEGDKFKMLEGSYESTFDDCFGTTMKDIVGVYDDSFWEQFGTGVNGVKNTGLIYYNQNAGYKSDIKFKYVEIDDRTGDLRVNYSFSEMWSNRSVKEMEALVDRHGVDIEFGVSDGTLNGTVSYTFRQWSSKMIDSIIPENTQSIPGYFNLSGINSAKMYSADFKIKGAKSEEISGPVIVQSEEVSGDGEDAQSYTGGASGSGGIVPRVIDITGLVKNLYNDRIDRTFVCKGGKSIDDLLNAVFPTVLSDGFYPEFIEWHGYGTIDESDRVRAANWNKQVPYDGDGDVKGYLLNDTSSYPEIDASGNPVGIKGNGDRYDLQPGKIEIYLSILLPFEITDKKSKYRIDFYPNDGEEAEIKTLELKSVTTSVLVKECLEEMFGGDFDITIEGRNRYKILQKDDSVISSLKIVKVDDSCYSLFGLTVGEHLSVQNRCIDVSSFSIGYHPSRLSIGGSWAFNNFNDKTQYCIIDLVRAPLEYSESDYRKTPPMTDCSNCYCPDVDCVCHDIMAGMWAKSKGTTMADGDTSCPACGLDLSNEKGAVFKPGDGIYTYGYDNMFNIDCFVTGFTITPFEKTSYRVSIRGDSESSWLTLANVVYDDVSLQYIKYPSYGSGSAIEYFNEPPSVFKLEKSNYRRARYVLIECDGKRTLTEMKYKLKSSVGSENRYKCVVSGDFSNFGLYSFSGLKMNGLRLSEGATEKSSLPIVSTEVNSDLTEMTFYFGVEIYNMVGDEITFDVNRWYGGLSEFKIYGMHYHAEDIKMTDSEEIVSFMLNSENLSFDLPDFPTQILSVSCGKGSFGGIVLSETENKSSLSWQTIELSLFDTEGEELVIDKITGGNYYFDYLHNIIYLPTKNQDGILFKDFEKNLINTNYSYSLMPTSVTIRYWSGNGYEIDFEAEAIEEGPSYQVEKDTITHISNSSVLPDNGKTVIMQDAIGSSVSRKDIPWYCYNKEAATLDYVTQELTGGTWKMPEIAYGALTTDNDSQFVGFFGANNSKIKGRAKTTVTFVGGPNKIISDDIYVKALARTIRYNKVTEQYTYERTGGIKNGCLIVWLKPQKCEGRKTLAYTVPRLIIYAGDRDKTKDFNSDDEAIIT